MTATVEVLKTLKGHAEQLCEQCLSDQVADSAALLFDLIEVTHTMSKVREYSPENEELYQAARGQMMMAVFVIAVFTAELTRRPVPFAIAASLN
jgi:hypothetical protein